MTGIFDTSAALAVRLLGSASSSPQVTMNMVATGRRVARPEDDPPAYVVADRMRTDLGALGAVASALGFGEAPTRVAATATDAVTGLIARVQQSYIGSQSSDDAASQEA